jgi:hypothetical protein
MDDALIVVKTCSKLDPFNGQITDLIKQLEDYKNQSGQHGAISWPNCSRWKPRRKTTRPIFKTLSV